MAGARNGVGAMVPRDGAARWCRAMVPRDAWRYIGAVPTSRPAAAPRLKPGCLVRSTLAVFGVIFLPAGAWMLYVSPGTRWPEALVLLSLSALAIRFAVARDSALLAAVDRLGGDEPASRR
jgi:hypothetical protein